MRVSLNLSSYFQDHRSVARLFISEDFKTIRDVKNRVKKVFKIEHFYLTCDNHYLPASEDVRILKSDDTIWVKLKNAPKHDKIQKTRLQIQNEESDSHKKTKLVKKKKNPVKAIEDQNACVEPIIRNCKEEKDEKSSKKHVEKNVKKRKIPISSASSESSSSEDEQNISTLGNEKIINFTPPNRLGQVNIVKTIMITNKKSNSESLNTTSGNITEKQINVPATENGKDTNSVSTEQDEQIENSSWSADMTFNESKRKRKRVRKRKPKINEELRETNNFTTLEVPVKSFLFNVDTNLKPKHIKFGEVTENGIIENNRNECEDEVSGGNAKEMDRVISYENKSETTNETCVNLVEGNCLSDEFIGKQPKMLNILPKIGDIIAFKIFRLSENYCPQISSNIVGKVLNFDSGTENVSFYIHCGLDQCLEPQGKFCLESSEEQKPSNVIEFHWTKLIDPKLLYP